MLGPESDNESYQWLGSEDLDLPPLKDINDDDEFIPDDGPAFHNGRMGDPLACRAEYILRQGCPFPGDDSDESSMVDKDHFHVFRTSETHHVIIDHQLLDDPDSDTLINPDFFSIVSLTWKNGM